jgi:nitroreductase
MMTRRSLFRHGGLGLAGVLVAGTGILAYRAYDQGVLDAGHGPAYSPWTAWQQGERVLRPVRAAVLAPSPHNAQAWLFSVAESHIDVYADLTRRTGALDPFDRELHIGLGAAIENLVLTARADGWAPTVEATPTDDGAHIARVTLSPGSPRVSELYHQIGQRHTNRYPFADRAVDREALEAMSALALPGVRIVWVTDDRRRHEFGELLVTATQEIIDDPDQLESDHRWFRHGWDDIQSQRDGITLDAAGLPAVVAAAAKLLPAQKPRALGEAWLDATVKRHTATAAAYGIVAIEDIGDLEGRLRGGRTLERAHLWATRAGLAMHHMNQITERVDREVQIGTGARGRFGAAVAGFVPDGYQALCSFRLGHPTRQGQPSPRRSIDDVVLR